MNSVILNSKVSPRFDKHANVLQVMDDINKSMEKIDGINARKRFTVMVGGKYAFRDKNNANPAKRYSLIDKPFYFYSEVQARDAVRAISGARLEEEIISNS
jgi:hypothetical protein